MHTLGIARAKTSSVTGWWRGRLLPAVQFQTETTTERDEEEGKKIKPSQKPLVLREREKKTQGERERMPGRLRTRSKDEEDSAQLIARVTAARTQSRPQCYEFNAAPVHTRNSSLPSSSSSWLIPSRQLLLPAGDLRYSGGGGCSDRVDD